MQIIPTGAVVITIVIDCTGDLTTMGPTGYFNDYPDGIECPEILTLEVSVNRKQTSVVFGTTPIFRTCDDFNKGLRCNANFGNSLAQLGNRNHA